MNPQQLNLAMSFSREEFIRQYQMLSAGSTKVEQESANSYIDKFRHQPQAWDIAQDLIINSSSAEISFIGTHIRNPARIRMRTSARAPKTHSPPLIATQTCKHAKHGERWEKGNAPYS